MFSNVEISTVLSISFITLYSITVIGLVLIVLLENRNPLKTIPWIIVLIFIPGIGLIFYYFFGRNTRRERIISRKVYRHMIEEVKIEEEQDTASEIPEDYRQLTRLLTKSNYSAIFNGSDICVYTNGEDKFNALLDDLKNARHHIHLQYYIFEDDKIGNKIKETLITKAREGVEIRILYDDVGSWNTPKLFFEEMKKEKIETHPFLKVVFPIFTSKVNYRNHRKTVIIDGEKGFMGGMNIADRYIEGNDLGPWRDTHFKITGSGVYGLQASFLLDWHAITGRLIRGPKYYPKVKTEINMSMQIVTSGPTDQWRTLMQAFIFCISNAKNYIYIQTPYFLPTESLSQALHMAALGGVDVRLMIPEKSDTRSAHMATLSYIDKMLRSGVKIYYYNKGFLHSKLLLIDNVLTCFGSSNFDFRSFEHNFEINAFVYHENFALKMKEVFMNDLHNDCEEVLYEAWKKRPITDRLKESFMRLFSPLL